MEKIVPNFIHKVEVALLMDKQSCHYQVEFSPDEALAFLQRADAYNGFTREDLTKLVSKINEIVPRMNFASGGFNGQPNPNNGRTFHTFSIGNEGSRVIYLKIIKTYLDKESLNNLPSLIRRIRMAADTAHADENSFENEQWSVTFRFWWD